MFIHNPNIKEQSIVVDDTQALRMYSDGNSKYPSITSVLGQTADDSWLVTWRNNVGATEADRVSRTSSTNGTMLHSLCEDYLNNKTIDFKGIMPIPQSNFKKMKSWLDDNIDEVYAQEIALMCHLLKVAGRADLIAIVNGKLSVVDFKTSKRPKQRLEISSYFTQCSFYAIAFQETFGIPIKNIVIPIAVEGKPIQVFEGSVNDSIGELKARVDKFYTV